MTTIKKLIEDYLTEHKTKKLELVKMIGYKNSSKGLRNLNNFITHSNCNRFFLEGLSKCMEIDISVFENLIAIEREKTRQQEQKNGQKNFKPHIEVLHEFNKPTGSITILAMIGVDRFKTVELPHDIIDDSLWEQIETVREVLLEHFNVSKGGAPFFGRISGYRYFYKFEEWIEFSVDGEIKGYFSGNINTQKAMLRIGGKLISSGLFNKFQS